MRIVVYGNSGSGKSTLARELCRGGAALLALDDIAWEPGVVRRSLEESVAELVGFVRRHERWVIEGCYGELVRAALPYCEELWFLNPGTEACVANCRRRPYEPSKFESPEAQDQRLAALLEWVRGYETREDEFGLGAHRSLLEQFEGRKHEFRRLDDYPVAAHGPAGPKASEGA
ncbi:MAG: shikimate kinase [Planctomycetes bacterium]|nr:shikimate kinase [Planctomycetota bacterium]